MWLGIAAKRRHPLEAEGRQPQLDQPIGILLEPETLPEISRTRGFVQQTAAACSEERRFFSERSVLQNAGNDRPERSHPGE